MIVKDPRKYKFGRGREAEVYNNKDCRIIIDGKRGGSGRGVIVSETIADKVKAATKEDLPKMVIDLLEEDHYNSGGEHYLVAIIGNKPVLAGPLETEASTVDKKSDTDLLDCIEEEGIHINTTNKDDTVIALADLAKGTEIKD